MFFSRTGNELPLESSGCFSYITAGWVTQVMIRAYRYGLSYSDLFNLPTPDHSKESAARLQRLWEEEQESAEANKKEPNFAKVCAIFCKSRLILATCLFSVSVVLQFLAPVIYFHHKYVDKERISDRSD